MSFYEKLRTRWRESDSLLCVGLDTDRAKLPPQFKDDPDGVFAFNCAIIEATADLVCAYKPQIAYYALSSEREAQLEKTFAYLEENHPTIPVILDAKRGDIGATAKMYAREAFERFGADAVTLNPYLGGDTLEPFLKNKSKGGFLLCRTSNPGAGELQDLEIAGTDGKKLYQVVAEKATTDWNRSENVGLVVGATYPSELAAVRAIVGDMPLLVPGVGTQGGDIRAVVENGHDSLKEGLIINASRAVIYASSGKSFAEAARKAASKIRDEINKWR